jgi:hypothetical protein
MPQAGDVMEWADDDPAFAERLAEAKKRSALMLVEDLRALVRAIPEGLAAKTFAQHLGHLRLTFSVDRMLFSLYDPHTFGRIRGPRVTSYAELPPRAAAVIDPVAVAEAQEERDAFRADCTAFGVKHDFAEVLLNIAEDDEVFETAEIEDEAVSLQSFDRGPSASTVRPPLSRRDRRAMAAMARKAPTARATSPPN